MTDIKKVWLIKKAILPSSVLTVVGQYRIFIICYKVVGIFILSFSLTLSIHSSLKNLILVLLILRRPATQALQCETAEELMETVKAEGIELTKEEAEAYLAELDDYELDSENLKQVAGGECWGDINQLKDCPKDCTTHNG